MGDSAALRQDRVGATFLGVAAYQGADAVQYVEAGVVVFATLAIAWAADQLAGRRGVGLATLVALTGAGCGTFLAVRVFAVATLESWGWALWSWVGAVVALIAFFLFRSKR